MSESSCRLTLPSSGRPRISDVKGRQILETWYQQSLDKIWIAALSYVLEFSAIGRMRENHPSKGILNHGYLNARGCRAEYVIRNAQVLLRLKVLERPTMISLDGAELMGNLKWHILAHSPGRSPHLLAGTRAGLFAAAIFERAHFETRPVETFVFTDLFARDEGRPYTSP
jgi:hypothetical protein